MAAPADAHSLVTAIGSTLGPAGVDLFFVISGFVVYLAADRIGKKAATVGRWRAFREFAVKRVFRIYPIYWVVFAVASVVLLTTNVDLGSPGMAERPGGGWLCSSTGRTIAFWRRGHCTMR